MIFKDFTKYGYTAEAKELASKTFGYLVKILKKNGILYEYYALETGESLLNKGFENWTNLVLNIPVWLEEKKLWKSFSKTLFPSFDEKAIIKGK